MWELGCRMSDGGCRMADVGWRMWDGGCGMSDVGFFTLTFEFCILHFALSLSLSLFPFRMRSSLPRPFWRESRSMPFDPELSGLPFDFFYHGGTENTENHRGCFLLNFLFSLFTFHFYLLTFAERPFIGFCLANLIQLDK